jgi:hypothetical protein
MAGSDPTNGGGNKPGSGIAFDGSNLKVPTTGTGHAKFRDAANIKVPPKPAPTEKPKQ